MAFNQALIASRRISKDEKNEARLRYTELKARMKHNYGQSQQRGPKKINIKR